MIESVLVALYMEDDMSKVGTLRDPLDAELGSLSSEHADRVRAAKEMRCALLARYTVIAHDKDGESLDAADKEIVRLCESWSYAQGRSKSPLFEAGRAFATLSGKGSPVQLGGE